MDLLGDLDLDALAADLGVGGGAPSTRPEYLINGAIDQTGGGDELKPEIPGNLTSEYGQQGDESAIVQYEDKKVYPS